MRVLIQEFWKQMKVDHFYHQNALYVVVKYQDLWNKKKQKDY